MQSYELWFIRQGEYHRFGDMDLLRVVQFPKNRVKVVENHNV